MKILLASTLGAALLCAAVPAALAQPASAPCAAGPAASGMPGDCPGGGPHGGGRMMMKRHWGKDYTPGWSLMTEAERRAHRDKMQSLQTQEECRSYMKEHHDQMVARAKERGRSLPAQPRRDACAQFKPAQK